MSALNVSDQAGCNVIRSHGSEDGLEPCGRFQVEHWRDGKRIGLYDFPNAITNEGKNSLLNQKFNGATAISAWYIASHRRFGLSRVGGDGSIRPHRQRQRLERVHDLFRCHAPVVGRGLGFRPVGDQRQPRRVQYQRFGQCLWLCHCRWRNDAEHEKRPYGRR